MRRRGAVRPEHAPGTGRLAAGLPRHLRDRAAQPGAADPLRDPERARRRRRRARLRARGPTSRRCCARDGLPLFSVDTHRAGRRLRRARLQPVGRARLHERARTASTSPACRCAASRAPARAPARRRRRPLHVQPRAAGRLRRRRSCIGDGEEVVGEITEVVGAWKRGGRADPRAACCASSPTIPGVYVPAMYDVDVRRAVHRARSRRAIADVPARRREAHGRRPRRVAVPEAASSCRSPRSCTTGSTSRSSAGCTRGCRFCQAGHDHPPGARAPGRAGAHDGRSEGLRRTGYDEVALTSLSTADFSGIDGVVADIVNDPDGLRQRVACRCRQPAGRRVHRRHRRRDPEGPPHRPHVRARGRHVADAPGDQQADHRGRPLRRRRRPRTRRAGGG